MIRRIPALFPLILAALLAIATYWLQFVVSNERSGAPVSDRGDPDTIVERFHVDKFDAQGRLTMNLTADQLRHYPKDDSADLVQPRVNFLAAGRESTWRSEKARVTDKGDRVLMTGNVRGVRAGTAEKAEQVLTTSEAALQTQDELATFPKPVTLVQGGTRIEAGRGQWNNIDGLLKLWQVDATFPRSTSEQN